MRLATRPAGAFTFAERPDLAAPEARIIWHADFDPGTLDVAVVPVDRADPDHIVLDNLAPWLTVVTDRDGGEHAVLSDGWRRIRLDVEAGSLARGGRVLFLYRLQGLASARARLLPMRRFLDLARHRRFTATLFPRDPYIDRCIRLLRVHDALAAGASQREIGEALFGAGHVARDWKGRSDSLRSRVRRLVRDAAGMAEGGYRSLMRGGSSRP
jgi:hypothetical protein